MERYVGMDVSLKETSICVVDGSGEIVSEGTVISEPSAIAEFIEAKAAGAARRTARRGTIRRRRTGQPRCQMARCRGRSRDFPNDSPWSPRTVARMAAEGESLRQKWGDKECLLTELDNQICTLFSNFAVGVFYARHCRPTLFFYVVPSIPGTFFFQFFELLIFLRILVILLDTNRCQAVNDGSFSHFHSHFLGSATRNPSTPNEADEG